MMATNLQRSACLCRLSAGIEGVCLDFLVISFDPPHPSLPVGGSLDTKQGNAAALWHGLENSTPWEPSSQVVGDYFAHLTVEEQGRQVQSSRHATSRHAAGRNESWYLPCTWPPTLSCGFQH